MSAYSCGHERRDLARGKLEVPNEAAALEAALGESMRDSRIEPEARDVEEQVAIELARVNQSRVSLEDHLKRSRWIERDAELASEPVAGSAWHDRE